MASLGDLGSEENSAANANTKQPLYCYDAPRRCSDVDHGKGKPTAQKSHESEGPSSHATRASYDNISRGSLSRRKDSVASYRVPDGFENLGEVATTNPQEEDPHESPIRKHASLEPAQGDNRNYQKEQGPRRSANEAPEEALPIDEKGQNDVEVSKIATTAYTLSYLILFSFLGTLAREGLTALTRYKSTPVIFTTIWANFGGSLIMGFLAEDRMLFRFEKGTPTYDQLIQAYRKKNDEEDASPADSIDLAAAKKTHLAMKKTIPLYIGLTTGFCGSFTSFSSFIRDVLLAITDNLATPGAELPSRRNGGYAFMDMLAVILTTVSLSLSGLLFGAHIALTLERLTPSLPYKFTRTILDRAAVVLGCGCWIGAILLSVFPPHDAWRGRATFSLVFSPLGCLGRFYLAILLNGKKASFPLGTFAANVFGTAVLGMAYDIQHVPIGGVVGCQVLQGIEDGFCGCLTTISTWVAELSSLKRKHAYIYGSSSVVVSLVLMIAIMGGLRWSDGFATILCKT